MIDTQSSNSSNEHCIRYIENEWCACFLIWTLFHPGEWGIVQRSPANVVTFEFRSFSNEREIYQMIFFCWKLWDYRCYSILYSSSEHFTCARIEPDQSKPGQARWASTSSEIRSIIIKCFLFPLTRHQIPWKIIKSYQQYVVNKTATVNI